VVVGRTGNPEYSCLADFDGDGRMDLAVCEGDDLEKGLQTGLRLVFGPQRSRIADPEAWHDAGHVPGTEGRQLLYCAPRDLTGDGLPELVVGGRRHPVSRRYSGLMWLEAPADPGLRRDPGRWQVHLLDPDSLSGHAFTFADLDGDGDEDIADANADWDTVEADEELYWYANPGPASPDLRKPWARHSIWRSKEFYAKPQVAVGDVNADGLPDLCTQTQNAVHLFLGTAQSPPAWRRVEILKPDLTQWIARPVVLTDLDADGRIDILGALIHNDGHLPADKAAVFWMTYAGDRPEAEWRTWPIKMSDGYNSRRQWIGEKWDHLLPMDLDGDGDLDVVGNVEEHYRPVNGRDESFFSVVWFENPLR